jgi:hypothetical protein
MEPKKPQSDLMHLSGAGIQMVLIIGIFVFAGRKLDQHFQLEKPLWTLGLSVLGVLISLVFMMRAFSKSTKK